MFKSLFNEGYTKAFMDRIEFRRKEYYENRRIATIKTNAAKMAMNWTHEYPTGTPLSYIRDDIIETWERNARVGIYSGLDGVKAPTEPTRGTRKDPKAKQVMKKYKHEWRNPPDENTAYEAKLQREEDTLDNIAAYKVKSPDEV
jgi:hypothetical protein